MALPLSPVSPPPGPGGGGAEEDDARADVEQSPARASGGKAPRLSPAGAAPSSTGRSKDAQAPLGPSTAQSGAEALSDRKPRQAAQHFAQ